MKKSLSVLLSLLLVLITVSPAFAVEHTVTGSQIPVVVLGGDGDTIYDAEGNYVFDIDELGKIFNDTDSDGAVESVMNVLKPFLIEGVLFNKWDNYYAQLESEIGELFEGVRLDNNGNVSNGSHISQAHQDEVQRNMRLDRKGSKGYYSYSDYHFWYDWRLSPLEVADQLNDFIESIKSVTGSQQVAIIGRCVGVNVILAYITKYGSDSIHGLGIDGTASNGGEFLSEAISGKFKLDGPAVNRFLIDTQADGNLNMSSFVSSTVEFLTTSGLLDGLSDAAKATIYGKIIMGVTSALALSTIFTMPCYWGFVSNEDYEDALLYVFGEEGSEKRAEYAGLIEKIKSYHDQVSSRVPEILEDLHSKDVKLSIISKYGYQMLPICASCNELSDQYTSVKRSSFGATTSDIYTTLSDEYIAARVSEGKGKYISPDKQVDASTCLFPDYFDLTQFMVYEQESESMIPMTVENCNNEHWNVDMDEDHPDNFIRRIIVFFKAYFKWIRALFDYISLSLSVDNA